MFLLVNPSRKELKNARKTIASCERCLKAGTHSGPSLLIVEFPDDSLPVVAM